MKKLNNQELNQINGGSMFAKGLLIAAGISFLIGVIDGYIRPLRCN